MSSYVTLSEVAEINPRPPKNIDISQEVSFLPMAAVSEDGYVAFEEKRVLSEVKKGFTYFERGDFLIAKITPCFENGKAALTCNIEKPIGYGSTEFHVIRATSSKLDKRYLYHLLWSKQFRSFGEKEMRGAAGQKRISTDFIKSYSIPLPPLKEQKRIAAILDKADAIRRKRQQAIDLTDQLLRSVFLDMFGDPVTNPKNLPIALLGEVSKRVTDGTHQSPDWADTGIPFLFIKNIVNHEISYDVSKYITEENWRELTKRCPIEKGDVLYTTVGSYGNAALVKENTRFCFQRHIAHIKPNTELINPIFLWVMMNSSGVKKQADKQARGIAQKTLNLKELKEFIVFAPSMEEQIKFVKLANKVELEIETLIKQSSLNESLFASLVQQAFQGELNKQTETPQEFSNA